MAISKKEEEYEIIPHQILSDLRDELDAVKQRLQTPVGEMETELLASIADLKNSITQLNDMVKSAAAEVRKEEKEGIAVQIKRLNNKIDEVSRQNEQIAHALLSVANMIEKSEAPPPRPMPPPRMAPPQMAPPRAPPMPPPRPMPMSSPMRPEYPMPPPPPDMGDMPPPPGPELPPGAEFEPKKKGLLGVFFKK